MCKRCETRYRRMQKIVSLLQKGLVTADEIAGKVGVSSRTVYRYVEDLRQEGLPIEGEAGVGYLMRPKREVRHVD